MIIGRDKELITLDKSYRSKKSELVVVYGRRRIGKSTICNAHREKYPNFSFEGVEGYSSKQHIRFIADSLKLVLGEYIQETKPIDSWPAVLDLITLYLKKIHPSQKKILFFDEFQWLAAGRSTLPALIKRYWDNDWAKLKVQLILCGSVSSYMVKKVIKSKALYGRIDLQLNVKQLSPRESAKFFGKDVSSQEMLKHLVVFGGIPKYLADLDKSGSFQKNLTDIFFDKNSAYINEYEKIFYSQFKEYRTYEKIVTALSSGPLNHTAIAQKTGIKSGGGLKSYLQNLENAEFIGSYNLNPANKNGKVISYRITDPFLRFYFYYVKPNLALITSLSSPKVAFNNITKNNLAPFLGFAFENFCNVFALYIAARLDFEEEVTAWGPFVSRGENSFQIDLCYFRRGDIITICEAKYSENEIGPKVISEVEIKLGKLQQLYPHHTIQKMLLAAGKVSKALKSAEYFDHVFTGSDFLV